MNALMESEKQTIINTFESFSNDYWKTLGEISSATQIKLDDVVRIVLSSEDFIESSHRRKNGEPLFTTRKVYRAKAPFIEKLLGAFKNRVD